MIESNAMRDLLERSPKEIEQICGLASFKAREVFSFIHKKLKTDLDKLTILKLEEREKLRSKFFISYLTPVKVRQGKHVKKAAFRLEDGSIIESVLMDPVKEKKTVCVSTQVGCPLKCTFCATGVMEFKRNLSVAEILSQVYYFARKQKVTNIVFMGMGEPFLNYSNSIKAANIFNHKLGQNIAARKITFSTVGILRGIEMLAKEKAQYRLAWSFVSPFDHVREKLIHYRGLPSIVSTHDALVRYKKITGRRITIEYVVLKDINDSPRDIKEVANIARSLEAHVNLIYYNASPGLEFERGDIGKAEKTLKEQHINTTVRRSFGTEIFAACGQLSSKL